MNPEKIKRHLPALIGCVMVAGLTALLVGCGSRYESNKNENYFIGDENDSSVGNGISIENGDLANGYNGSGFDIATKEDCEASNGVWKQWGLKLQERCNIRANDYGKKCYGSSECEGECITNCLDQECSPGDHGTCTEFRAYFGCVRFWRDGTAEDSLECAD